jgi:cell division protein FtsI/penicillin-binding protein 2
VIQEQTAHELVRMMEGVVDAGTGTFAALQYYRVAGKTGTAQKSEPNGEGYSDHRFMASFLGIVPSRAPRMVVVVVLDEPERPNHQGGVSAGPIFKRFAEYAMARWSVPREPMLVARGEHPQAPLEEGLP